MLKRNPWSKLGWSGLIAAILTLPLAMMELINRRVYGEDFPLMLYGILWLLGLGGVWIVADGLGLLRANTGRARRLRLAMQAGMLVLVATMWIGVVADQWPCFMGLPNCD